jgi:SAM-dependent methyltransferase
MESLKKQNSGLFEKYVCPRTHAALVKDGDVLRAVSGNQVYPLKNGIPQFLRFRSSETAESIAQLDRLNRLAGELGWKPALQTVHGHDEKFIQYVTDPKRANFIDLLPITKATDVLEIGPGLGQFTAQLARRAGSVWGLEVVAEQAEFSAERCRQEALSNVHLAVGGDDCRLPYGDGVFGLVIVNLVFEWCASRCTEESPAAVQRRFLNEIHRVLKPGGALYLATKNRFALHLLIGKRDAHCHGIRFGSALPRPVAGILMRIRGHRRALGSLYSHSELKALLRESSLDPVASYWATPEMRHPEDYVPTNAEAIRLARQRPGFVQGEMRSTRLLMKLVPAPLVKHVTPGLAFVAMRKP